MESAVGTNIDDPGFSSCPYSVSFGVISPIPVLKKTKKKVERKCWAPGEHILQTRVGP